MFPAGRQGGPAYGDWPGQLDRSVATLRESGVRVLYGEGGFRPNPAGAADRAGCPWHLAPAAAGETAGR